MKKLGLLLILIVLAVPLTAGAWTHKHHDNHSVSVSDGSSFDIEDGELVLTHKSGRSKDRVVITEDGDLTINGDRIETDERQQKLLRKFYRESAELEEMAEDIADDAAKIAAVSTKYAAAQLTAALRSLSDDDDEADEADMGAVEVSFESEIEKIEKSADRIENQADRVVDIADELQESIPELDDLDWFLDD